MVLSRMRLRLASEAPVQEDSWQWQVRHAVTSLADLERELVLSPAERRGAEEAMRRGLPLSITPYYLSLVRRDDPSCPIRRQCVPTAAEAVEVAGDLRDPLGEEQHEVAPFLVQRYPDRALLLVTDRCGVYCRFCTRSRMVGAGGGAQPLDRLEPAFQYLAAHPAIQEVIVSGGDPGVMSDGRIEAVLARLHAIPSLAHLRFATRVPVTLPQRVTPGFVAALRGRAAVWLMTHFNHPRELSQEAQQAIGRLVDGGVPIMNQTVLLRGINDDPDILEALFRGLVRYRVRPYYLLQADVVRGTGHLRTPLARGIALMEALQGRVSGIALPKFIVDTPGGRGKVVVGPDTVVGREGSVTFLRTFRGERVAYPDPPDVTV